MLKTVFIGSYNPFNQVLVHWLSRRTEVVGVVWIQATAWQRTWAGRLGFAKKRWRRYGIAKALNEALMFLYYHARLKEPDEDELRRKVIEPYVAAHGPTEWKGGHVFAANVNAPEVLDFVAERRPDVVFAMCINNFFGEKIRSIPRLGVLLWHEGITPEYRGLYSPFWAVHNQDLENIGYTLLRMNEKLDAGEIYVQGRAVDVDPRRHGHNYIGHKAIFDSLPAVDRFLQDWEAGRAKAVQRTGAKDGYYTYPGITDYIRQQWRLRRLPRVASTT